MRLLEISNTWFDPNSEFFLLASYSALPTFLTRLVELQGQRKQATIFCFSSQIYRFLSPLTQAFTWIRVIDVDVAELSRISPYRPWEIWKAQKILKDIYLKWFSKIPAGCAVHFFNCHFALPLFFMIWQLRNTCEIHYTDCDLSIQLVAEKDNKISSLIKDVFLYLIYQMPIQMVSRKNDPTKPFPSLKASFFEKSVKAIGMMVSDLTPLRKTDLFQHLRWKSNAKILWLMSPVLDYGLVLPEEYVQTLRDCVSIVKSIFPASEQVIKFHPRVKVKEDVWDISTEKAPDFIPVEFLDLPNLTAIISISSSSAMTFSTNISMIGLVDIIPYASRAVQAAYKGYFMKFTSNSKRYCPTSLDELREALVSSMGGEN
jgi:hypothetical protein